MRIDALESASGPTSRVYGPSELLREVVRDLIRESTDNPLGSLSRKEVAPIIVRIVNAVERLARDPEASIELELSGRPRLYFRVIRRLNEKLLAHWQEVDGNAKPSAYLDCLASLRRLEQRLQGSTEESLEGRLAAPDAFDLLVELAHDLRSPLTSILFLSETVRKKTDDRLDDREKKQLGLIYSAALGLVSVANDVMELAQGEFADVREEPSSFSLGELMDQVAQMVRPMAEVKDVELRIEPPSADRYVGYPVALGRVFLNLTTNALKFSASGGWVALSARPAEGGSLEFSVQDTGRGLSNEAQKQLYQPLQKSKGRDGYFFSGSGLGLHIVRKLLESMDSTLDFETAPNQGTRFFFTLQLPRARDL